MVIDSEYRDELLDWIGKVEFICPFSVTLSMREHRSWEFNRNFRHFCNRLNQSYLQNRYRRYKERLTIIPTMEGGGNTYIRPHVHCIIDNPFIDREKEFIKCIRESWGRTMFGQQKVQIDRMRSLNWLSYIMKFRSKKHFKDSVDWTNFHINKTTSPVG